MTARTALLTIHIAAVGAWLGANLLQLVVVPRIERAGAAVATAWHETAEALAARYYGAAGGVIAVTGVLMVLDDQADWSSGFVWVGIAVVVIGGALGGMVFTPKERALVEAHRANETERAASLLSTIRRFALVDTLLVLVAILAMVDHWRA